MQVPQNWQEFIDSTHDAQRLDYVWRYSTIPIAVPENVSTHSYWVATYSAIIHCMHDCNDTKTLAACVLTALVHDLTESMVGDFVRVFKYKTKALKSAIDEAESLMKKEFGPSFEALFQLTDDLCNEKKSYVNAVVKAADFMSLHNFMIRELKRGNREIMPFFKRMIDDLDMMTKENENVVFKTNDADFEPAKFYRKLSVNANKTLHI